MNLLCVLVVSMGLVVGINAAKLQTEEKPGARKKIELSIPHVSQSERIFSFNLYKSMATKLSQDVAVSTLDAYIGLGKLSLGATRGTRKELNFALNLPTGTAIDPTHAFRSFKDRLYKIKYSDMCLANVFFYRADLPVKSKFERVMKKTFDSKKSVLVPGKSKAPKTIEEWYSKRAEWRGGDGIVAVDDALMPENSFTLIGTTYIKGTWAEKFDRCNDMVMDGGNTYGHWKSPYMQIIDEFNYGVLGGLNAKFVEIPLSDVSDVSMFIIRPDKKDGLHQLEVDINESIVRGQLFNGKKQTVQVMLPEFYIEHEVDLAETLRDMGVKKMFNDDGNFGGAIYTNFAKVNEVRHKVVIDGRGSGKRHVCPVTVPARGDDVDPIKFEANHPFLILVATNDENPVVISIARYSLSSSSNVYHFS